jgi:hypothetical protein
MDNDVDVRDDFLDFQNVSGDVVRPEHGILVPTSVAVHPISQSRMDAAPLCLVSAFVLYHTGTGPSSGSGSDTIRRNFYAHRRFLEALQRRIAPILVIAPEGTGPSGLGNSLDVHDGSGSRGMSSIGQWLCPQDDRLSGAQQPHAGTSGFSRHELPVGQRDVGAWSQRIGRGQHAARCTCKRVNSQTGDNKSHKSPTIWPEGFWVQFVICWVNYTLLRLGLLSRPRQGHPSQRQGSLHSTPH